MQQRRIDAWTANHIQQVFRKKIGQAVKDYAAALITPFELHSEFRRLKEWAVNSLLSPKDISLMAMAVLEDLSSRERATIINSGQLVVFLPVANEVQETLPQEGEEGEEVVADEHLLSILREHPLAMQIGEVLQFGADMLAVHDAQQLLYQYLNEYGTDSIAMVLDALQLPHVTLGDSSDSVTGQWFVNVFLESLSKKVRREIEEKFI